MSPRPKILLLDIETFPAEGYWWGGGLYKQSIIKVTKPWRLASFAYKWYPEGKEVKCCVVTRDSQADEIGLLKKIWPLLDEAEIVVAHHAKFDLGKITAKFLIHNFGCPSHFTLFCTYLATRPYGFTSRRLNDLAREMGLGEKIKHEGFDLWEACMKGDRAAIRKLAEYNKHDVALLEGLYERIKEFRTRENKSPPSGVHPPL